MSTQKPVATNKGAPKAVSTNAAKGNSTLHWLPGVVAALVVVVVAVVVAPKLLTALRGSAGQDGHVLNGDPRAILQQANVPLQGIVRGNALPDGSYPDVTGRRQILDFGVTEPRNFDGIIPFKIAARVPVEVVDVKKNIAKWVIVCRWLWLNLLTFASRISNATLQS
jgi:hypothetical protein